MNIIYISFWLQRASSNMDKKRSMHKENKSVCRNFFEKFSDKANMETDVDSRIILK